MTTLLRSTLRTTRSRPCLFPPDRAAHTSFAHGTRSHFPASLLHRTVKTASNTIQREKNSGNTYTQPSDNLSQHVTPAEETAYSRTVEEHKDKATRAPWMREGSDRAPVKKIGSVKSFAKGKLLTTPSRMLKLIIPLMSKDEVKLGRQDEEIEPLALLVHPQQPLSYLERLIQSELPSIKDEDGRDRIPNVSFRAPDSQRDAFEGEAAGPVEDTEGKRKSPESKDGEELEAQDVTVIDGKRVSTGKLKSKSDTESEVEEKAAPQSGLTETKSPVDPPQLNGEEDITKDFVRWSSSTEIGDFIRDAARRKNFALDIEGAPRPIIVGVPSFEDRTYYLRMRLRQRSIEIGRLADIKRECDELAERGAKRVAMAGGAALVAYWCVVYMLTFRTSLGWDVMEPVTYLVGLSTLIGGYAWFLVHNRQVSYRSAMNFTISRRQGKLYEAKGLDIGRWEDLVTEGNKLRREIKMVADEYDVTWDEKKDADSEKVIEALEAEKKKKKAEKKATEDEEE